MATNIEDSTSSASRGTNHSGDEEESQSGANFECNICLDTAKDAVISMCGHLFCWSCLHRWLETRFQNQICPVCKAAISREKVIPLYGRGSSDHKDPRENIPPRPAGQRTEPPEPPQNGQRNGAFGGFPFNDGGGMHFQFGIGAFPFALFTSFNHHGLFAGGQHRGFNVPPEMERELPRTTRLFLVVLACILYWNIFFL